MKGFSLTSCAGGCEGANFWGVGGVGSGDMLPWENLRKTDFLWTPFSIFHGGERKYRAVKRRSKSQSLDQI